MKSSYSIGLDFGTNSVRAVLVNTATGREVVARDWSYMHGEEGVILSRDPHLARQHPGDYIQGTTQVLLEVVKTAAKSVRGFQPEQIVGIGVDTTGSTPLPLDKRNRPLALDKRFSKNPAAMAWLWKDHTSAGEAAEITELASRTRPHYIARCGGAYSSEWFFSKILHCLRTAPEVFDAAYSWVELADYVPALLTGTSTPEELVMGVCAAGHKAMFNDQWGGYPDAKFLARLDPKLAVLRSRLPGKAHTIDHLAGRLTPEWSRRTGLPSGIPVAVGALDAHMGAVGSGISTGTLVKILGTSSCDIAITAKTETFSEIPGLCGIVDGSVLPGFQGLEAGQSAVGDIFNWFVHRIQPGGKSAGSHEELSRTARRLKPGESGLLALDWNHGNRSVLVDPQLTGLLIGQTLYTMPAEIYRALIEATAFGALIIINRLEESGIKIDSVTNCGGIAEKNELVMQIYADVIGRPMRISASGQTCALGAGIAGAVVGKAHPNFPSAQKSMTGLGARIFRPDPEAHAIYRELFALYKQLHDAFGTKEWRGNLHGLMKQLLAIRAKVRI